MKSREFTRSTDDVLVAAFSQERACRLRYSSLREPTTPMRCSKACWWKVLSLSSICWTTRHRKSNGNWRSNLEAGTSLVGWKTGAQSLLLGYFACSVVIAHVKQKSMQNAYSTQWAEYLSHGVVHRATAFVSLSEEQCVHFHPDRAFGLR